MARIENQRSTNRDGLTRCWGRARRARGWVEQSQQGKQHLEWPRGRGKAERGCEVGVGGRSGSARRLYEVILEGEGEELTSEWVEEEL